MNPKGTGILYLLKDRFQIYINLIPSILEYRFDRDAIRDITVTDKEKLENYINQFIDTFEIPASNLILVIADNASYCKVIQSSEQVFTPEEQSSTCLKHVSFSSILSKEIQTSQGLRLFSTNQELYSGIKEAFEKRGFEIDFVMPGLVYETSISSQPELTVESAGIIFKQTLEQKQFNLLPQNSDRTEQANDVEDNDEKIQRKKDIMRLYAYCSIFGMLLIGFIVIWNVNNPAPTHNIKSKAGNQKVIVLPSLQETKNLTVNIVNGSGSPLLATQINDSLVKYVFRRITIENQNKSVQSKDMIVFSSKPSPKVRDAVLTEVKQFRPNITVQSIPGAAFDIIIILAK